MHREPIDVRFLPSACLLCPIRLLSRDGCRGVVGQSHANRKVLLVVAVLVL